MKECPNCGMQIEDDTLTECTNCGVQLNSVDGASENTQPEGMKPEVSPGPDFSQSDSEVPLEQPYTSPEHGNDQVPQKGSAKKWLLIGGICAVILIAVIILLVSLLTGGKGSKKVKDASINNAYITLDGSSVFWKDNGDVLTIKGDTSSAVMTKDQKHIIVHEKDGVLVLYDAKGENKKTLDQDVFSVEATGDKFLFYAKNEQKEPTIDDIMSAAYRDYDGTTTLTRVKEVFKDNYPDETLKDAKEFYRILIGKEYEGGVPDTDIYRYTYSNENLYKIEMDGYAISPNNEAILFYKGTDIFAMKSTDEEPVKISGISGTKVKLLTISDDGMLMSWEEIDKAENITIYCMDQGEKEKIADYKASGYSFLLPNPYDKGKSIMFMDMNYDKIFIKNAGRESYSVSINGYPSLVNVFTDSKMMMLSWNVDTEYIYLLSGEDGKEDNLYSIDKTGNRERLQEHISNIVSIKDGVIYYIDNDDTLFKASISKNDLIDIQKITSEVDSAYLSDSGKYLMIRKELDDRTFSLYYAQTDKLEVIKVAEDVSISFVADDDSGIVYVGNADQIKGTDTYYGDLYYLNFNGKDEKQKIASDVIDFRPNITTKNNIFYFKYDSVKDDNILTSMVEYKDGNNKTLAEDVIYPDSY